MRDNWGCPNYLPMRGGNVLINVIKPINQSEKMMEAGLAEVTPVVVG